jgi:hypothetical protein
VGLDIGTISSSNSVVLRFYAVIGRLTNQQVEENNFPAVPS